VPPALAADQRLVKRLDSDTLTTPGGVMSSVVPEIRLRVLEPCFIREVRLFVIVVKA
jgi:hypothetical protein